MDVKEETLQTKSKIMTRIKSSFEPKDFNQSPTKNSKDRDSKSPLTSHRSSRKSVKSVSKRPLYETTKSLPIMDSPGARELDPIYGKGTKERLNVYEISHAATISKITDNRNRNVDFEFYKNDLRSDPREMMPVILPKPVKRPKLKRIKIKPKGKWIPPEDGWNKSTHLKKQIDPPSLFMKADYDLSKLYAVVGGLTLEQINEERRQRKLRKQQHLNKTYRELIPSDYKFPTNIRRTTNSIQRKQQKLNLIEQAENENKEKDENRELPTWPISNEFNYMMELKKEDELETRLLKMSETASLATTPNTNSLRSSPINSRATSPLLLLSPSPSQDKGMSLKQRLIRDRNQDTLMSNNNINNNNSLQLQPINNNNNNNNSKKEITFLTGLVSTPVAASRYAVEMLNETELPIENYEENNNKSERVILTYEYTKLLRGHSGNILCIDSNIDYFVTGSDDGYVIQWDSEGYNIIYVYKNHYDAVNQVFISTQNNYMISASNDRTIFLSIAHLVSHKLLNRLFGHTSGISSLAFERNILLSGGQDGKLFLWSSHNEDPIFTFPEQNDIISKVFICLEFFVTATVNGDVRKWHKTDLLLSHESTGSLSDLVISKDKTFCIGCYNDGIIKVLSLKESFIIRTFETGLDNILHVINSRNSQYCIIGGNNGEVIKVNLDNGEKEELYRHESWILSLHLINDLLVSSSFDGTVYVYNSFANTQNILSGTGDPIYNAIIYNNGIILGLENNYIVQWCLPINEAIKPNDYFHRMKIHK